MILSHFTHNQFIFDNSKEYKSFIGFKPCGLWLSNENEYGWKIWCEQSGYGSLVYETKFEINFDNILVLNTEQKIIDFYEKYKYKSDNDDSESHELVKQIFEELSYIDWKKVTKKYDGIVISPYSYGLRTKFLWYNAWDCASGCVWNLSCLKLIATDLVT
jgi:hypothetical protein